MSQKLFCCAILIVLLSATFVASQITNIECNQENHGRHFPSGFNCTSYYTCYDGNFFLQVCPHPFWFSFEDQACVIPDSTECVIGPGDGIICNQENHGRHFPTPYNCTSYYTCFNEIFHLQNCPYPFYFIYEQQACVHLPDHECNIPETTTTPIPFPTECPPTGIARIPDLYSCTNYFICFSGFQIRMTCAPGLYFSRSELRCVRPEESDCNLKRASECPPENDPKNIVFLSNQEDCQKYFICYDGMPEEFDCGPTLHFDPENNWCIKEEDSSCKPTILLPDITEIDCPASSLTRLEFVAHPQNCQFYFACFNNQSHLLRCSPNLLFDHIMRECFFRESARCYPGSS